MVPFICHDAPEHSNRTNLKISSIMEVNEISLSKNQVKPVIDLLNDYLASQIHYQKLHGAHWNIEGENFLHCI